MIRLALTAALALPRWRPCCGLRGRKATVSLSPKVSLAWLQPLLEEEQAIIGPDWYPYGIEQNRPTIDALLQYTHEHGLIDRRLKIEELFTPATLRDMPLTEGQQV